MQYQFRMAGEHGEDGKREDGEQEGGCRCVVCPQWPVGAVLCCAALLGTGKRLPRRWVGMVAVLRHGPESGSMVEVEVEVE